MANDAGLIRDEVKLCRDGIKTNYRKDSSCYICGDTEDLQLHHFSSVAQLWEQWKRKNKIVIKTEDDMYEQRNYFYDDKYNLLVNECVTLCSSCHNLRLHKIYGKSPSLATAKKQKRWVDIQRHKRLGNEMAR